MFSVGKPFVALATLSLVSAAMMAPATTFAAELPATLFQQAAYTMSSPADPARTIWDETLTAVDLAIAMQPGAGEASASAEIAAEDADETAAIDPELECMAKVVHHEAGNQSRRGQLAVAQTILNRIQSGRFADTICGVANQPGQFFRTAAYDPDRSGAQWQSALSVSRQARRGEAADVAPGALFFRASYASANRFFRSRQQVATLGDHVFYR
ncbi:MAG: cell wall hydrolase SleB [Sphingomonas bacterium]|nr:cell wall hydrolase [Sphingomonas bacterium]MDB5688858.1 cell wall hydrolase SleB [Sphingomonas bacterium]